MSVQIALGGFPEFLTPTASVDLNVVFSETHSLSSLMRMTRQNLSKALEEQSALDHVVFRLSGENPMEFIQLLRIYGLLKKFRARTYSASFWTMDSHHLGRYEAKAAKYFDQVFVAHKNYLHLFPQGSSHYLPCSFSLVPEQKVDSLLRLRNSQVSYSRFRGVCAPFAAYPWQKRNGFYLAGLWAAQELRVPHFFGTVRGGETPNQGLIERLLSYDVVLNFSLSDDLNMRNFEALALNKILLTNKVPDHSLLKEFASNIVFVDPQNHDFKNQLELALKTEPKDISKTFLVQHSIRARVKEISSILLGVETIELEAGSSDTIHIPPTTGSLSNQRPIVLEHAPEALLARSGFPDWTQLRRVAASSSSTSQSIGLFLSTWAVSFSMNILSRLVRKTSWVRAFYRAVCAFMMRSNTSL